MRTYNSFNEMAGTTGSLEGAGVDFQTLLDRTGGTPDHLLSDMSMYNIESIWNLAIISRSARLS